MDPPLLSTKLFLPQTRRALIPRPRLLERLQAGLRGPLTLIAAPAGSGKTTLLAQLKAAIPPAADSRAPQIAWVSLDADDNHPARFMTYLLAALDTVDPALTATVAPLLAAPELPPLEALFAALINTVSALPHEIALVLDDYHVIEAPDIHQALAFLLERLPTQLHLVLLTRADPPLPLARLRARGQLVEIRAEHLRFTAAETAAFFSQSMGLTLPEAVVAAIEARTEGWIAGLQLAALSLQGRDAQQTQDFVAAFTGSHHYIADYLVDEVLNRQSEAVRAFLLHTSILERLCAPLCDALLCDAHLCDAQPAAAILHTLEHSNLFLMPLDDEHCWYRYHHLFTELLRHRLRQTAPARLPELHRRAAAWFDSAELAIEAIDHASAAADDANVHRLLRRYFPGWMRTESRERILRWLERLQPEFLHAEPWLCVVYAWMVWSAGQLPAAETYLNYAQQALAQLAAAGALPVGDIEYDALPAEILAFRALIASRRNDLAQVLAYAQEALAFAPAEASTVRAIAQLGLYLGYRRAGQMEAAIEACRAGLREAQAGAELGTKVSAAQSLGTNLVIQGRLHEAAAVYREVLRAAAAQGELQFPAYGLIRLRLADLYYQWNQLDEAEGELQRGLERADLGRGLWSMLYGRHLRCQTAWARGDLATAHQLYQEIEQLVAQSGGTYYAEELRQQLLLLKTRLGLAETWDIPSEAALTTPEAELPPDALERRKLQLQAQVALDRLAGVPETLARLLEVAVAREHRFWQLELYILQALVEEKLGHRTAAVAAIQQALALAEPEGIVRPFLDAGAPVRTALQAAVPQLKDIALVGFARALLQAVWPGESPGEPAAQPLLAPLSARELELLALVAAGRSNQEIARQLYITVGTVKRHTANIFNKLDARNRTEAVAKARALGLL